MKFNKDEMYEILDGDHEFAKIIEDEVVDTTRWSVIHKIIFQYYDKYYETTYSCGATEYQDESPWEYDDEVIAYEVIPKETVVIKYVRVKNDS